MTARLYAIVPMLDEEPNVPTLVASLVDLAAAVDRELALHAIFVDDGSTDGTHAALVRCTKFLPWEILRHPVNQGPGAAFATGFTWLAPRIRPEDWVLTMEGDATSKGDVILRMMRRRLEGYDVVLASPYMYGGGFSEVSAFRVMVSQVANGLVKIVMGIRGILTFSAFLRLYSGAAILELQARYGPAIVATQPIGSGASTSRSSTGRVATK